VPRQPAPSPRRSRARRGEGGALRTQLLDAAERLLAEVGDERRLTIRAVAAAAGVTSPSVYLHFADKDALVDAVALRAWDDLAAQMDAARAAVDDPFQALRHVGAAYVRWALDHAVQYELLLLGRRGRDPEARTAAADACLRHLAAAVEPCVRAGVFVGDAERLTLAMWAALHGYVALVIAHPELPWPADRDTYGEHVSRMSGLGTAVLSRLEANPPRRPASSERYREVLDGIMADLGARRPRSRRAGRT
jgi:AcrR family transcriptional regulator